MKLQHPSPEFDQAVSDACHGLLSEEQALALNTLLLEDPAARDAYLLHVELHARLASDPDLFAPAGIPLDPALVPDLHAPGRALRDPRPIRWILAAAAVLVLSLAVWWAGWRVGSAGSRRPSGRAVALVGQVAGARWAPGKSPLLPGSGLDPGPLELKAGLAQIVFLSGARVVVEGPASLELVSATELVCRQGRLTAEVPPPAHGFRVRAPRLDVTDLGTSFGMVVGERKTELHVFEGKVEYRSGGTPQPRSLEGGSGALADREAPPVGITADPGGFRALFDLQTRAAELERQRYRLWREAIRRRSADPTLLVHFDFDQESTRDWRLHSVSSQPDLASDAAIVGCQWVEGRWTGKPGLEFRRSNDRVRLSLPGEYEALTLAAWVRVHGLDQRFNALFLSDGFNAGTVHWLVRQDGVLGLTVIGNQPAAMQISASPPVIPDSLIGTWLHLAVVVDPASGEIVHYLNGQAVFRDSLRIAPPFRVGNAELGNWNPDGFKGAAPDVQRSFSGIMDEFCLFARALGPEEIRTLHGDGRPQGDLGTTTATR